MLASPIQFLCYFFTLTLAVPDAIAKEPSMLSNFEPCRLSDPNLNLCLKKALGDAIPDIARGVPRLGLPQMDPIHIESLVLSKGQGQSFVVFKIKDMDMFNLSSSAINVINFDPNNYKFFISIEARDEIICKGFYDLNGHLFTIPVNGKGRCKISMDNFKINLSMQFKKITRKGKYFLELVNISEKTSASRMHFNFTNLFNGNKVLGDTVNNLMNQNWKEMIKDVVPQIKKLLDQMFIPYVNKFVQTVPMSDYLQN